VKRYAAEFCSVEAKHCEVVKQDCEYAFPQFLRIAAPARNDDETNKRNQKKRKKMNKTNKSHKAFTVKKDTSPWHLASPPSHTRRS
jgi:hypothetical protein